MAFRSSTILAPTTSTSGAISVPAGAAVDDIAIVAIYLEVTGAVTPPAGFTLKTDLATNAATSTRLLVYWKRLTAADTGTYTFTFPSSWRQMVCGLWSGRVTTGDPFDVAPGTLENGSASTTSNNPGCTVATTGADLFGVATNGNGAAWTPPSGMTERQDTSTNLTLDSQDNVTAGATGTKTFTCASSAPMKSVIGALAPAGGGGTSLTATPSDSLPLTDAATLVADRTRTQGDALGLTDAATATADRATTPADALGLTDTLTAGFDRPASASDALGFTDAATAAWVRTVSPSDPLGLTDALTVSWDRAATIGDPLALTDAPTSSQTGSGQAAPSDPLTLTDTLTVLWDRVTTVDDLLGLTDAPSTTQASDSTKAPADPLGFTDATSPVFGRDRTPGDALGMSDSVVAVLERVVTLGDTLGLVDDATAVRAGANDGTPVRGPIGTFTSPTSSAAFTAPAAVGTFTTPTSRGTLS